MARSYQPFSEKQSFAAKILLFLAFLLQIVSFFTTYSGCQLYFGSVFYLAPVLIAIVIQGALFFSTISTFRSGKRRWRSAFSMLFFFGCSALLSYTGLTTIAQSPQKDYEQAFFNYSEQFYTTKQKRLEDYTNPSDAILAIINARDAINTNHSLAETAAAALRESVESTKLPPQTLTTKISGRNADGSTTYTSKPETNPEYQRTVNQLREEKNKLAMIEQYQTELNTFLNTTYTDASGKELSLDEFLSLAFSQEAISTSGASISEDGLLTFWRVFYNALESNNLLANATDGIRTIDSTPFRTYEKDLKQRYQLEALTAQYEISANTVPTAASTLHKPWIQTVTEAVGNVLGADFHNTNMNSLTALRDQIQQAAGNSYQKLTAFFDNSAAYAALTETKETIDNLPDLLTLALSRFRHTETSRTALICLILAIFTDGATILLGLVSSEPGKNRTLATGDPGEGLPVLSRILFDSLLDSRSLELRLSMKSPGGEEDFRHQCISCANQLWNDITDFLTFFELSECTAEMGYPLCRRYRDMDEIHPYLPMIAVLEQKELVTILPLTTYQEIEYRFHLGLCCKEQEYDEVEKKQLEKHQAALKKSKELGYVILLQSPDEKQAIWEKRKNQLYQVLAGEEIYIE